MNLDLNAAIDLRDLLDDFEPITKQSTQHFKLCTEKLNIRAQFLRPGYKPSPRLK